MIPIELAQQRVFSAASPLDTETIAFDAAFGRLLRRDVISDIDMPPFPRAAVDGFALVAEDLTHVPTSLRVVGEIPAGTFPDFEVRPGECARIMTGAPVPIGATAVEMVENTREADDARVEFQVGISARSNIAPRGSEVRLGDLVLRSGTRMDAPAIAVAASVGAIELEVGRRPSVAVIATGDELVPPGNKPAAGQIRNSNGFSLAAQVISTGCPVERLGVAGDDLDSLRRLIDAGLRFDVLLLSGGVSMGRYDLVEDVLRERGIDFLFDAVALKPGKPLVFGTKKRTAKGSDTPLVFGLPGNPVSTMVTFELFVRPTLALMEGAAAPQRKLVPAELTGMIRNKGSRRAFLPGWLATDDNDRLRATPIITRGSGDIVAFSKANALLVVPEDIDELPRGASILCYPLDSYLLKENLWNV